MKISEAIHFLQSAIPKQKGIWVDIGAGLGIFTQALDQLLEKESTIYALDKSISGLSNLQLENCQLHIQEQDFDAPFSTPPVDGILMANTLHYSQYPVETLENILRTLRPGGAFILIEYELHQPRGHWIPYPIPFENFEKLAAQLSLSPPQELARIPSTYGNNYIYLAKAIKN